MKKLVLLLSLSFSLATTGLSDEVQATNPKLLDPYCLDKCKQQFDDARSMSSIASHCSMANLDPCTRQYYNKIFEEYGKCIKSCQR
jgi:hypothetical protein